MMAGMTGHYSLWLLPSGEEERRLAKAIESLSRDPGGPRFDPHLTLLGGLDGEEEAFIDAARRLAASLRPVILHLRGIEFGDEYYRCLYIRVGESEKLTAAHREALRFFGKRKAPSFMPHVSLFYGTLKEPRRRDLCSRLNRTFDLDCPADRLRLVATGGGPPSWRGVCEIRLSGPRRPP